MSAFGSAGAALHHGPDGAERAPWPPGGPISGSTIAPVVDQRDHRLTLHSHAELLVQAAEARGQAPDELLEPGVDELRAALGIAEEDHLECWLLVDRSGSVLFDRDELQQVGLAWHFASFDSERDRIGILGFSGFGDYVNLFEFKTPLGDADRAMLLIGDVGGGGTPTAEAVAYAARMLGASTAEHRLVAVVTDAPANDRGACAEAVRAAAAAGVRVVGALKPENRHEHPGTDHSAFMTEQFGSDWFEVDAYTQTPTALLEHLARSSTRSVRSVRSRRSAQSRRPARSPNRSVPSG